MKTKIIILSALATLSASAQLTNLQSFDLTTPATNTASIPAYLNAPGYFTNLPITIIESNHVTRGESVSNAFSKTSGNFSALSNAVAAGGYGTVTIAGTITLTNGASAYVVQQTNGLLFAIPQGPSGSLTNIITVTTNINMTNSITAINFSNSVLSSQRIQTYSTNNVTWGTSNFLARVNGIYKWRIAGGIYWDGNPIDFPTNYFIQLVGSFSGTNTWFVLTNNFQTSNAISIAATGAGGGIGSAVLWTLDHWEDANRTNYYASQFNWFEAPTYGWQAATKWYVDATVAASRDGNFVSSIVSSNTTTHTTYTKEGITVLDMQTSVYTLSNSLSISGTNFLLLIPTNQMSAGWQIMMSTNTDMVSGWAALATNSYTVTTNSGVATFVVPLEPWTQYFWPHSPASGSATFSVPIYAPSFNSTSGQPTRWNMPISAPGFVATSGTVTNSTGSTGGLGAGLMRWDTDYVYVSVGTNFWKRAALSSW